MELIKQLKEKAKKNNNVVVLPEGEDERILKGAEKLLADEVVDLIILGDEEKIKKEATNSNVIDSARIINPVQSDYLNKFADVFFDLREHKGISREDALEQVKDPLYFGTMLVHMDKAQGLVAGAANLTGDVLRPAFQIVKTAPGISIASGVFIMQIPDCNFGSDGILAFADCAVNPSPDSEQLAEIAVSSARTVENLLEVEPVVALLSFSTKGSSKHELVKKVVKAKNIACDKAPDILFDGELQADASLVPEIAKMKAPDSDVAGRANILVFPGLEAGNIGYKLVQRIAGAEAIGPLLQGLDKPINDLSRGCSVEDVVNVVTITSIQAEK